VAGPRRPWAGAGEQGRQGQRLRQFQEGGESGFPPCPERDPTAHAGVNHGRVLAPEVGYAGVVGPGEGGEGEHGANAVAQPCADGMIEQEVLGLVGWQEERREEKRVHDQRLVVLG
jgi:hypothetical protein